MQEQKQAKYQFLYLINEDVKSLFDNLDKKKCKIICSQSEFESFIATKFQVKEVCILVELDWSNSGKQFHGYEIAKELINSVSRHSAFNLYFISAYKRQELLDLNKSKNRIFTQKFFHSDINADFTNINVPQLSERKFDYLKNYCLLESGILDRLEHDFRRILENLNDQKLKKLIEDIKANEDILTNDIVKKAEKLTSTNSVQIKDGLTEIHRQLQVLQSQINNPGETAGKKSYSTVMLIEDEPTTLKKLEEQFGQYFHTIKSFPRGTDAYKELENNAQKYDVVITDMELLDGNFDDEKLGIDILEVCEKEYPFIVTRVITSLPKNALKRLIGKGLDEIIFKSSSSESVLPPFENLVEFVQHIDKEVKQRKVLRSMPGPKGSWWGKFLTKELYLKQLQKPEEFTSIWNNAKNSATRFLNGEFDHLSSLEKLSVEFKQVNEPGKNPQAGWEIIELLLTHRLIALWFASKHNWEEFHFTGDSKDAYVNKAGFQEGMESKPSKTYFNTFLGLSVSGASDKREERRKCKIIPKDLFPEEIEWLSKSDPDILQKQLLRYKHDDLLSFLERIVEACGREGFSDDITFEDAIKLFDDIIENNLKRKADKKLKEKISIICQQDVDSFYDKLPEQAKIVINKIKEEIFLL